MGAFKTVFTGIANLVTGGGASMLETGISAVAGYKGKKLDFEHDERMQTILNGMKKEELFAAAMDSARKLAIADSQSSSWFAKNIRPIGGFIALGIWLFTIVQRSLGVTYIILQEQDYKIIYTILGFYYGSRLLEKLFNKTR